MGFFGGGASVDLASPPAIGNTTPNTGAFTTIQTSNSGSVSSPSLTIAQSAMGLWKMANGWLGFASQFTTQFAIAGSSGILFSRDIPVGWSAATNPVDAYQDVILRRDAAGILAQRDGTTAQESRLYGTFTSTTNYQRMTIKSVKQTLSSLSGASSTTTGTFIPDGAVVVGVTTRVVTLLAGATGYTIGDGTDADRWGDITGTAVGTTSDNRDWTAGTIECFTAGGNITLTAKTSNFTAGAIEICVFYLAGEAD